VWFRKQRSRQLNNRSADVKWTLVHTKSSSAKRPESLSLPLGVSGCGLEFTGDQRWGIYQLFTRPAHKSTLSERSRTDVSEYISLRGS